MFRGTFDQRIDEKGRISVPSKFRDVMRGDDDERLFVTNFAVQGARCLDAHPYAAWVRLEQRLRGRTDLSPRAIQFYQSFYFPGVQECVVDKQGRILVPPRLRDYAGLAKDVVFTGVLDKFQIWDRDTFQPVFDAGERILLEDPSIIAELHL